MDKPVFTVKYYGEDGVLRNFHTRAWNADEARANFREIDADGTIVNTVYRSRN